MFENIPTEDHINLNVLLMHSSVFSIPMPREWLKLDSGWLRNSLKIKTQTLAGLFCNRVCTYLWIRVWGDVRLDMQAGLTCSCRVGSVVSMSDSNTN